MNLTPESSDEIRKRVAAHHRLTRRARIEAMETEIVNLKALAALMHSRIIALKSEVMSEDATTIRVRALPEVKARRERPFLD